MKKKNNKEIGCLGCVWNPFDSPSDPCPDAFKDHAQDCNAYSHRPVVRLENAGEEKMELISRKNVLNYLQRGIDFWYDDDEKAHEALKTMKSGIEAMPTIEN